MSSWQHVLVPKPQEIPLTLLWQEILQHVRPSKLLRLDNTKKILYNCS